MEKTTLIYVNTSFIGFHRWVGAPDEVKFLRNFHRHVFHVKVSKSVSHGNRQIEFFMFQKQVKDYLNAHYEGMEFEFSCEQIAEQLLTKFDATVVEVSEDKENGAVVTAGTGTPVKITEQVRKKCFVGIEAEGPCRGTKTLFVPGSTTPLEFYIAYRKVNSQGILNAYYGAGNDRTIKVGTLLAIRKKFQAHHITIEVVRVPDEFVSMAGDPECPMIVSMSQEDKNKADYIKTVTDTQIIWKASSNGSEIVTELNDPLFSEDKEIE